MRSFALTLYAPISQNGQTHSNNSSANCRRIVWVFLTILWDWRLKDKLKQWLLEKYFSKILKWWGCLTELLILKKWIKRERNSNKSWIISMCGFCRIILLLMEKTPLSSYFVIVNPLMHNAPKWSDTLKILQSNFIEITFRHGCSPLKLLHIFWKTFS